MAAPLQPAQGEREGLPGKNWSAQEWQENTNERSESSEAIANQGRVVIGKDCFKADNNHVISSAEYNYDEVLEVNYKCSAPEQRILSLLFSGTALLTQGGLVSPNVPFPSCH